MCGRDHWTQDKARAAICRCERDVQASKEQINITRYANIRSAIIANAVFLMQWIAGILMLALAIGFRARIAAALYYLFVSCLALRLRFNRTRKRFLDNAIKEAENRLGS